MMFAKQNSACASRNALACFQAFLANIWVGRYVFAIIAIACIWTTLNG
jgi:4-hydroxybenzoate polyprenyltransferase